MSQLDGTSRFCPVCSKLLGQENHPAGFVIDVCPAGHGSFFDQEEFEEVGSLPMDDAGDASKPAQSKAVEDEITVVPDQVEDSQFNFLSKLKVAFRHSDKPCPRCEGINMVEIKFGVQQLLVDECPKCQGIWLDAGEEAMLEELVRGVQLKFESQGNKSYHSWYLLHRIMHCENLNLSQNECWSDFSDKASLEPLDLFQRYVKRAFVDEPCFVVLETKGTLRRAEIVFLRLMGDICRHFAEVLSGTKDQLGNRQTIDFIKIMPSLQDVRTSLSGLTRMMRMIRSASFHQTRILFQDVAVERKFKKYNLQAEIERFFEQELTRAFLASVKRSMNLENQGNNRSSRKPGDPFSLDMLRSLLPYNLFNVSASDFLNELKDMHQVGHALLGEKTKDEIPDEALSFELESNAPFEDFLNQIETLIEPLRKSSDDYQVYLNWSPLIDDASRYSSLLFEDAVHNPFFDLLEEILNSREDEVPGGLHRLCSGFIIRALPDIAIEDLSSMLEQVEKIRDVYRKGFPLVPALLATGETELEPVFLTHLKRLSMNLASGCEDFKGWLVRLRDHLSSSKAQTLHGLYSHAPIPSGSDAAYQWKEFLSHLKSSGLEDWVPDYFGGITRCLEIFSGGARTDSLVKIFLGTAGIHQQEYEKRMMLCIDPRYAMALMTSIANALLPRSRDFEPGLLTLEKALRELELPEGKESRLVKYWLDTKDYYLKNFSRIYLQDSLCPGERWRKDFFDSSLVELYSQIRLKDLDRERKSGEMKQEDDSGILGLMGLNSWLFGAEEKAATGAGNLSARNQDEVFLRWERLKRKEFTQSADRYQFLQKLARFLVCVSSNRPVAIRIKNLRAASYESIVFLSSMVDCMSDVREAYLKKAFITRDNVQFKLAVFGDVWDLSEGDQPGDLDNYILRFLNKQQVMEVRYSRDLFQNEDGEDDVANYVEDFWEKAEAAYLAGLWNDAAANWQRWLGTRRGLLLQEKSLKPWRRFLETGIKVLDCFVREGHHGRDDEFSSSLEHDFQLALSHHKGEAPKGINEARTGESLLKHWKEQDDEIFRNCVRLFLLKAQIRLNEKRFDEAKEVLGSLEKHLAGSVDLQVKYNYLLGQVYFQAEDFEQGAIYFNTFANLSREVMDSAGAARAQLYISDAYLTKGAVRFSKVFLEKAVKSIASGQHPSEKIAIQLRNAEFLLYEGQLGDVSHMVQDHLNKLEKGFASELQARGNRILCWASLFLQDRPLLSKHLRKLRKLAHELDHPYYLIESELISFLWMMHESVARKEDLTRPIGNLLNYVSKGSAQDHWAEYSKILKNFLIARGKLTPPWHKVNFDKPGNHFLIYLLNLDLEFVRLRQEKENALLMNQEEESIQALEKSLSKNRQLREQFVKKTGFELFGKDLFELGI